jgi:hypothetical protein
MNRRQSCLILGLGLVVSLAAAYWIRAPGYMDSEYYFATGQEIAAGHGFVEPFLWNYLDDPQGLPHPSHLYWMPLTSMLAAAAMRLLGPSFRAAQLPFVLLAEGLPWLSARICLGWRTVAPRPIQTAILAALPGFFLPFLLTTDAFALFAWLGAAALICITSAREQERPLLWAVSGILIGLGHLTRADGLLLLVPACASLLPLHGRRWTGLVCLGGGYLLVMAPWMLRDWIVVGSPLGQGNVRALWLTSYDQLFAFPASRLTQGSWLASGLQAIVGARWHALLTNANSLLLVNGLVILAPLAALGAYRLRSESIVRNVLVYLITLFGVMTFVFPFAGARGGYFHSSVALMPFVWGLAPIGLEVAIGWARQHRGWGQGAGRVSFAAVAAICACITIWVVWSRAIGPRPQAPLWESPHAAYSALGSRLKALDPAARVIAVNDPPGFYLASGLSAVVIPDGSPDTLRQVVTKFDASWVILDANHPTGLADLYARPDSLDWLQRVDNTSDVSGRPVYLLRVLLPVLSP